MSSTQTAPITEEQAARAKLERQLRAIETSQAPPDVRIKAAIAAIFDYIDAIRETT